MAIFSDQVLVDILKKAARRVNRKLCLFGTADEIVIDDVGTMTSPDPEENGDLYDLVLLQAECMIASREYQSELRDGGGVMVSDGEQTTDTRSVGVARGTFFNSPYGPCAELNDAIKIEKLNRTGGPGGPGKLVW
jgi:hypothetical protein